MPALVGSGLQDASLILTATLTAKPMDTRGHRGQNGTRKPRLSEATTRHGTQWTVYLPIRNQQVAGSIAAHHERLDQRTLGWKRHRWRFRVFQSAPGRAEAEILLNSSR